MAALRQMVGLLIAALMLLTAAFVTGCGKKQFKITKTMVVTQIDDKGQPVGENYSGKEVKASEKAVYLWFQYPRLSKPRKIRWQIKLTKPEGDQEQFEGELQLEKGDRSGHVGIELNPGETLPPGEYEIILKELSGMPLLKDPSDPKKEAPVKFTVR